MLVDDLVYSGARVSDSRHLLFSVGGCGATGALDETVPGAARIVEGLALPAALRRGCSAPAEASIAGVAVRAAREIWYEIFHRMFDLIVYFGA